jgi:hypothetical protein
MDCPFLPEKVKYTAEELQQQEKDLMELLDLVMLKAEEHKVTIRVTGSLAFRIKASEYSYIAYQNNRCLADLDFVTYSKYITQVQDLFFELGWSENQNVLRLFGNKRRIFYHPEEQLHADIFLDKLRFCHEINLKNRLQIDYPTISLIDLLLAKLQIVEINQKDLIDLMTLLRKYPVSQQEEQDKIHTGYLTKICSTDWGWWKTATENLHKISKFSQQYLTTEDADVVSERAENILSSIAEKPKSLTWKIRNRIGEKLKWYNEVEEVRR